MIVIKILALVLLGYIAGMAKAILDILWDIYAVLEKNRSELRKISKWAEKEMDEKGGKNEL